MMGRTKVPYVIGMDVGGSMIRMAGISRNGVILGRVVREAVNSRRKDALINQMVDKIRMVIETTGEPEAIGIGVPGFLDYPSGVIHHSPNFAGWRRVPIRTLLQQRLDYQVVVENDANAAALGEAWKGPGRSSNSLLYMGLGTGVGGGIIMDGRVYYGAKGLAGELGHITVDPDGPICGCGNRGCVETYASSTGLVRQYLAKNANYGTDLTAAEISRLAGTDDRDAVDVFSRAGKALGTAIASLINIFNPARVVIGGGVSKAWRFFSPSMKVEIACRSIKAGRQACHVVRGMTKDRAGILGAGASAWQAQKVEIF